MKTDTTAMIEELRANGYTEAQIEREVRYIERLEWEEQQMSDDEIAMQRITFIPH